MPERYDPTSGTAWSVEPRGLLVLPSDGGPALRLEYPDAAVWDLLAMGNPPPAVVEKIAAMQGIPRTAAERTVFDAILRWTRAGLIMRRGGDG